MINQHRTRFLDLAARRGFGGILYIGCEYGAAFYLLSARKELYDKACGYVDPDGIDFARMLRREDLSGGYRTVVRLAWNLFCGGAGQLEPLDLCCGLDDDLFDSCLIALTIRRAGLGALAWWDT